MTHAFHHLHKRKRVYQKQEPYPHPNKLHRIVDHLVYLVALLGPILTIPQVTQIWFNKTAVGVSLFSWSAFVVMESVWLTYGIIHKEKPIIITNIGWLTVEILIVIGVVIYS